MRRLASYTIAVGLLVCSAAPALGLSSSPTLRLASRAPLVIAGQGFAPRESVTVTLRTAEVHRTRAVTTSANGRFAATFTGIPVSRCSALTVRATSGRGEVATMHTPPLPACMPARSP